MTKEENVMFRMIIFTAAAVIFFVIGTRLHTYYRLNRDSYDDNREILAEIADFGSFAFRKVLCPVFVIAAFLDAAIMMISSLV